MANIAIILYLGFLLGLISHFEKIGQRDQNENLYFKLFLINHRADFNEI